MYSLKIFVVVWESKSWCVLEKLCNHNKWVITRKKSMWNSIYGECCVNTSKKLTIKHFNTCETFNCKWIATRGAPIKNGYGWFTQKENKARTIKSLLKLQLWSCSLFPPTNCLIEFAPTAAFKPQQTFANHLFASLISTNK